MPITDQRRPRAYIFSGSGQLGSCPWFPELALNGPCGRRNNLAFREDGRRRGQSGTG